MEKAEIKRGAGKRWNSIAWVFIVLQLLVHMHYVSEVCSEGGKFWQIVTRGFLLLPTFFVLLVRAEFTKILYLTAELVGFNVLGIFGLIVGLLVWLRQKNKKGKATTIAAIVTLFISSILYFGWR